MLNSPWDEVPMDDVIAILKELKDEKKGDFA